MKGFIMKNKKLDIPQNHKEKFNKPKPKCHPVNNRKVAFHRKIGKQK